MHPNPGMTQATKNDAPVLFFLLVFCPCIY